MAETLTYDSGVDTESREDNLTPDEQDSLKVGTEIVNEQEQLLAGKYENAQELEKAYIELEKKLGSNDQDSKAEAESESEEVLQEEPEESPKEYSPAAELITSASEEYNNAGELTPETLQKFSSLSSKELVEAYMEVQASMPDTPTESTSDIAASTVNEVKNFAGGEQAYQQMVDWAGSNLSDDAIAAFDNIVGTGNVDAIKLAVNGLKSQYQEANGYEGEMLQGKAPSTTKDVYRSQAELVAAMSDRRYDNDPAYRQDVIEKLSRSDNLNF